MFDNIIGQAEIIHAVSHELQAGTFPRAALFSGPACAGKLSTALETARLLTCEEEGAWTCACGPCRAHRLLLHPDTVLLGRRPFRPEFRAARDALLRTNTPAARFLFLRSVRKLTRRFDPHIFQAEESRRREIQSRLLSLEDALASLEPDKPLPEAKAAEKLFAGIEGQCEKLEAFLPAENVPVGVIRNLSLWAHTTSPGARKVVILESAGRLLDASRNALLKILEEPPPSVHFILIAERAGELIPTIRSRLRPYRFRARTEEETREILLRVFREDNPQYHTLKSYFLAWEDIQLEALRAQAERFTEKALEPGPVVIQNELPELFRRDAPRELVRYFLEELVAVFQSLLKREGTAADRAPLPLERFEAWNRLVRARAWEFSSLNLAPGLFVENLFLSLREAP